MINCGSDFDNNQNEQDQIPPYNLPEACQSRHLMTNKVIIGVFEKKNPSHIMLY